MSSMTDVVGYWVEGETVRRQKEDGDFWNKPCGVCLECAIDYPSATLSPIDRDQAGDEGRMQSCDSCGTYLDQEAYEAYVAEGLAMFSEYQMNPYQFTRPQYEPFTQYLVDKGRMAPP